MLIHTTSGMDAHLYYIVGLSMLDVEDRKTCMSVTDHHEYHKFKCMLAEQDHLKRQLSTITDWAKLRDP